MNDRWKAVGRWLLVPIVFAATSVVAFYFIWFFFAVDKTAFYGLAAAPFSFPPSQLLKVIDDLEVFLLAAVWAVPTAAAVGFALRGRIALSLLWGFSISLLLTAVFVYFDRELLSKVFAVIAAAALVCGLAYFASQKKNTRGLLLVNIAALGLLLTPRLIVLASVRKQPPLARKVWSIVLPIGTEQPGGNEIELNSGQFLAFAADRLIVVDAMAGGHAGERLMSGYRLLSLDRNTGTIRNQMDVPGDPRDVPSVFGTKNGQVTLVCADSISLFNPDLTATGMERKFSATGMWRKYSGEFSAISPDGTTLGMMTKQETTLLEVDKLEPVLEIPNASGSALITSIGPNAVLNVDLLKDRAVFKGKAASVVNLVNGDGERELFHDDCLPPGHFLSDDRVLIAGCVKIRILNTRGELLKDTRNAGTGGLFAGVSRDGSRFALQYHDERGDPSVLLYEQFVVYDAATLKPIASVSVDDLPDWQSWSAFSPDGHFFAVGNPDKLTLYQVP